MQAWTGMLAPTPAGQTFWVGRFLLRAADGQSYTALTKRPLCCLDLGQMKALALSHRSLPRLTHSSDVPTQSQAVSDVEGTAVISKVLAFREFPF